jgi:hypothetical protein
MMEEETLFAPEGPTDLQILSANASNGSDPTIMIYRFVLKSGVKDLAQHILNDGLSLLPT